MKFDWRKQGAWLGAVCVLTTGAWAAETVPDDLSWVVSAEETAVEEPAAEETAAEETADAQPEESAVSGETEQVEPWKLVLVNPWHPLPENFTVELVRLKNGMQVDKRIYNDLDDLLSDCRNAGQHPKICSAYRTKATQTRLYNNKVSRLRAAGYSMASAKTEAARWVALPDTSEHQLGLALDIVSARYQGLTKKQEETAEQKWLMEHSWEYGFILRYPTDKSAITGIGYEPWHYRYVGRETAAAMHESGQCLEEYLGMVESTAQTAESGTTPS